MTDDPENHRNQYSSDYANETGCWLGQASLLSQAYAHRQMAEN